MPTVNIYAQIDSDTGETLKKFVADIRVRVAELLSGESRQLISGEISVRLIDSIGSGMIAPVEVEINAQDYPERAVNADRICLDMRMYIKDLLPEVKDARVWLKLVELGHSWTESEIAALHAGYTEGEEA